MPDKLRIIILALILYVQLTVAQQKANIIFFLVDDLGWADLGCYGSQWYETPNVDKLAEEGVRFVNAYAASPVSSPTRSAIMTGKNPARTQITQYIGWDKGSRWEPDYTRSMALSETTLAEALKENGYKTGFFGKWHLGDTELFWPQHQGFDVNVGGCGWGHPKQGWFSPYNIPGMANGPAGEHLTERLTREAVSFLDTYKDNPFLLYFALYQVHTPLDAKPALINKYKAKPLPFYYGAPQVDIRNNNKTTQHQKNPTYAAMVEHMDDAVGAVLDKIKSLGLEDNTIVFFTGDNGGLAQGSGPTSVFPLYAGKAWIFEGGFREPLIIKWPGVTQPGSISDAHTISMDFYPTILDMLELPPIPQQYLDGKSLTPVLKRAGPVARGPLFFHYPHHHNIGGVRPSSAIRLGNYKLIEFIHDNSVELYNLKEDPKERVNLAQSESHIANLLRWTLKNWRDTINANMPPGWPRGTYTPPTDPGAQANLALTEPWGPKSWKKGSQQTIRWQSVGDGGNVSKIAFSYTIGDDDIPLTGTARTSTQKNDTLAVRFAFDNDLRTRWAADPDGNYSGEWLEIDFGAPKTVNKVRIKECDDWGKRIGSFKIQTWNGSVWSDVHTGNQIGAALTVSFPPVSCRKARLLIQSANDQPTIWELSFFHFETRFLDSIPNSGNYTWTLPDSLPDSLKLVVSHRISESHSDVIKILPSINIMGNNSIENIKRYVFSIKSLGLQYIVKGEYNSAEIIDLKGRVIKNFILKGKNIQWDRSNNSGMPVSEGLYWIMFRGSKNTVVRKILLCQ